MRISRKGVPAIAFLNLEAPGRIYPSTRWICWTLVRVDPVRGSVGHQSPGYGHRRAARIPVIRGGGSSSVSFESACCSWSDQPGDREPGRRSMRRDFRRVRAERPSAMQKCFRRHQFGMMFAPRLSSRTTVLVWPCSAASRSAESRLAPESSNRSHVCGCPYRTAR